MWFKDNQDRWDAQKVVTIPAQPAAEDDLPSLLKGFKAVPPLITDIYLSADNAFLYVSCWGTGELHQYDVSDPFCPVLVGKVEIGGIVNRQGHPRHPDPLLGRPQLVEFSRDGKRAHITNSLYSTWDDQFYPEGLTGWMVRVDVDLQGGMALDPTLLVDFGEARPRQVRLEANDDSGDLPCYIW